MEDHLITRTPTEKFGESAAKVKFTNSGAIFTPTGGVQSKASKQGSSVPMGTGTQRDLEDYGVSRSDFPLASSHTLKIKTVEAGTSKVLTAERPVRLEDGSRASNTSVNSRLQSQNLSNTNSNNSLSHSIKKPSTSSSASVETSQSSSGQRPKSKCKRYKVLQKYVFFWVQLKV